MPSMLVEPDVQHRVGGSTVRVNDAALHIDSNPNPSTEIEIIIEVVHFHVQPRENVLFLI